jgi:hypothetical protein
VVRVVGNNTICVAASLVLLLVPIVQNVAAVQSLKADQRFEIQRTPKMARISSPAGP